MITLKHLAIGYKGNCIAEDINATLKAGELTCLIGRNGTGKSTLMRTIAGFLPPMGGQITLADGRDMLSLSAADRSKLIGLVLTDHIQATHLTAHELVEMGRLPYTDFWGKLSAEDKDVCRNALQQVGMEAMADRRVATLSDGERQKVMIAKALAQQTPIILLDEPTAYLDYPAKKEIITMLQTLSREQNKAILLSTHDLDIVKRPNCAFWSLTRTSDHNELKAGTEAIYEANRMID